MSVSDEVMQATQRVAAVDPTAWEQAGDSVGYGVTHQGMLDILSANFASGSASDWTRNRAMVFDIYAALSAGQQAMFDNASVSTTSIELQPQSYLEALGQETSVIAAAGRDLGAAILSPVSGAVWEIGGVTAGLAWKTIIPILLAIALVLFVWKR
jgi:hypothetical protein